MLTRCLFHFLRRWLLRTGLLLGLASVALSQSIQVDQIHPCVLPLHGPGQIRVHGKDFPANAELWTSFSSKIKRVETEDGAITFIIERTETSLNTPSPAAKESLSQKHVSSDSSGNSASTLTPSSSDDSTVGDEREDHNDASSPNTKPRWGLVRVVHEQGVSDPFLLCFHPDANAIMEVSSEHNSPEKPFTTTLPTFLTGTISEAESIWFALKLQGGESVTVETLAHRIGSLLDPVIRIWDRAGREWISHDDTPGFFSDAVFSWTAPHTGEYLLELRDTRFAGGDRHKFYLRMDQEPLPVPGPAVFLPFTPPLPCPLARKEPTLDFSSYPLSVDSPQTLPIPSRVSAAFNTKGSGHFHRFALSMGAGQTLRAHARTRTMGSALDVSLRLVDPQGGLIKESNVAQADDGMLEHTANSEKVVWLEVHPLQPEFGPAFFYHLIIEPIAPWFQLEFDQHTAHLTSEGDWQMEVNVQRLGYEGPIRLTCLDLPDGVVVEGTEIAAKEKQIKLKLRLDPDAPRQFAQFIQLQGESADPEVSYKAVAHNRGALRKLWPEFLHPVPTLDGHLFLHSK